MLPILPTDQRLAEVGGNYRAQRLLLIPAGRAQAANAYLQRYPEASIVCWYLDDFPARCARQQWQEDTSTPIANSRNCSIVCQADAPEEEFDLALVGLSFRGEGELSRDLLQTAFDRLKIGGHLVVAVDNPQDKWVHQQLAKFEKSVKVRNTGDVACYVITKSKELRKRRNFTCELRFRDEEKLIELVTRPGVFSHRQLDNGARQLIDAVEVFPEARLIDIGCGSGAVAQAMALREPSAQILAVDSNARALWCLEEGLRRNQISNVSLELNSTGDFGKEASFDMALGNPPYYADFEIAQLFIEGALRALRPGGRLVLVTKATRWYEENFGRWFADPEIWQSRSYQIVSGVKP